MYDKYSKIPLFIKNNKNICSNAKLLYGDISLLCHSKGYCFATNKFLADNLGVTNRTITRLLSELVKNELIIIDYCCNNRKIFISSRVDDIDHLG